jgi:hypothetical protein
LLFYLLMGFIPLVFYWIFFILLFRTDRVIFIRVLQMIENSEIFV